VWLEEGMNTRSLFRYSLPGQTKTLSISLIGPTYPSYSFTLLVFLLVNCFFFVIQVPSCYFLLTQRRGL